MELLTVVVGAGLALVASVFVQLFVVPRAETRKRRAERLEASLISLGEQLLVDEQQAAADVLWKQHLVLKSRETYMFTSDEQQAIWDEDVDAPVVDRWRQRIERAHREMDAAQEEHARQMVKVDWVVTKVRADARSKGDLGPLLRSYEAFCDAAVNLPVPSEARQFYEMTPLSEAGFDSVLEVMDEHAPDLAGLRGNVIHEVKMLLAGKQVPSGYEKALERRDPPDELESSSATNPEGQPDDGDGKF